jgi:hypothetical protein
MDKQTWIQLWYVPLSTATLTIAQVLAVSSACTTSSGGGGGTGGGGSGGTVAVPIPISDVSGLRLALAAKPNIGTSYNRSTAAWIDSSGNIGSIPGNPTDCVKVNGTSGPYGSGSSASVAFVDAEVPSGTLNGANLTFSLSLTPLGAQPRTLPEWRSHGRRRGLLFVGEYCDIFHDRHASVERCVACVLSNRRFHSERYIR